MLFSLASFIVVSYSTGIWMSIVLVRYQFLTIIDTLKDVVDLDFLLHSKISITSSAADKNYIELSQPEIPITQIKIQNSMQIQNFISKLLLRYYF